MNEILIVLSYIICIILVLLPPKWDPAIRFKEWIESRGRKNEK